MPLTKDKLKAYTATKIIRIKPKSLEGEEVCVRLARFSRVKELKESLKSEAASDEGTAAMAGLVAHSLCEEDGKPMYGDSEADINDMMEDLGAGFVIEVGKRLLEINGLEDKEDEEDGELEKN